MVLVISESNCLFELLYIPDLDGPIMRASSEVTLVWVHRQSLDGVGVCYVYLLDGIDLVDH